VDSDRSHNPQDKKRPLCRVGFRSTPSAFAIGACHDHPILFGEVLKRLSALGYDGVELFGDRPYSHSDDDPTVASRRELRHRLADLKLEISNYGADFWGVPLDAGDAEARHDDATSAHTPFGRGFSTSTQSSNRLKPSDAAVLGGLSTSVSGRQPGVSSTRRALLSAVFSTVAASAEPRRLPPPRQRRMDEGHEIRSKYANLG